MQDDSSRIEEKQTIKLAAFALATNLSERMPNTNSNTLNIKLANSTSSTLTSKSNRLDESGEKYYLNKKRKKRQETKVTNVRLSNGTSGRVEVQVNGEWGSICSYKFDIVDAAIVCQSLGK